MSLLGLILAVGARSLFYSTTHLPVPVATLIARFMRLQVRHFNALLLLDAAIAGAALLALLVIVVARRRPATLGPWVAAVIAVLCALNNFLFDADPFVAGVCFGTMPLLVVAVVSSRLRWFALALLAFALVLAVSTLPSAPVRVAILAWGALGAAVPTVLRRRLGERGAVLAAIALMPIATFALPTTLVFALPALRNFNPRTLVPSHYAYSFCEVPGKEALYAAVPVGNTGQLAQLRRGYVAEFDRRDFTRRAAHSFFDDRFFGGLRQLLCFDDEIQVTMNGVMLDGAYLASNTMRFRTDDPAHFDRTIYDQRFLRAGNELLGHVAAWDPLHDAIFYVSEWSSRVYRLDRRTRHLDPQVGVALPTKHPAPGVFGYYTRQSAIHRGRHALYISEWADGSRVFELDLDTLQVRRTFDTADTGSFGLAVDEGLDRLVASGLWGISVIDLASGELLARRRTGPGARTAVIDPVRDLMYVGTTFGGHIFVFDRTGARPLGRIVTGLGARAPYLTLDGRWLLGSDQTATYRWETAPIVAGLLH
jgi:hypothetical protein